MGLKQKKKVDFYWIMCPNNLSTVWIVRFVSGWQGLAMTSYHIFIKYLAQLSPDHCMKSGIFILVNARKSP